MITIEQQSEKLIIGDIITADIHLDAVPGICDNIKNTLTSEVSKLVLDLDGVDSSNYAVLILIKTIAEMKICSELAFEFLNADAKCVEALAKLGFENGIYNKKEYRKDDVLSLFETTGGAVLQIVDDLKSMVVYTGELLRNILYFIRKPGKLNRGEILYYTDKTGADAVPIVIVICFLMGAILAYQGIAQLSRFGLTVFVSNLVAFSIVRELGPLMVAIICTGRAGSAFASEIGTMKVNEEIDALTTMGIKPSRVLVIPKIAALMIVMPMLTIIGDIVGILGGALIVVVASNLSFYEYMHSIQQAMIPANIFESLSKSFVFAFFVAAVGCFRGLKAENDAKGVGNATTSAVVSGIFLIVIADAVLTFVYPQLMHLIGIDY